MCQQRGIFLLDAVHKQVDGQIHQLSSGLLTSSLPSTTTHPGQTLNCFHQLILWIMDVLTFLTQKVLLKWKAIQPLVHIPPKALSFDCCCSSCTQMTKEAAILNWIGLNLWLMLFSFAHSLKPVSRSKACSQSVCRRFWQVLLGARYQEQDFTVDGMRRTPVENTWALSLMTSCLLKPICRCSWRTAHSHMPFLYVLFFTMPISDKSPPWGKIKPWFTLSEMPSIPNRHLERKHWITGDIFISLCSTNSQAEHKDVSCFSAHH